jgi:hypothetical protein
VSTTIRRRVEQSHFVQIPNSTANDSDSLSLEALGLLVHLLHRPPDWKISCDQVRSQWKIGRDKLTALLRELRQAGYAELVNVFGDGRKVVGREYIISSRPDLCDRSRQSPDPENPVQGSDPEPEYPCQGKPVDIEKTESLTNTDIPQKPPVLEGQDQFERFMAAFRFDLTTPPKPARKAFAKLSADERELAIKHAGDYVAQYFRARGRRPNPVAYLRNSAWEAIALHSSAIGGTALGRVWVQKDSADWKRLKAAGAPLGVRQHNGEEGWDVERWRLVPRLPAPTSTFIERTAQYD